jgi:hypothetical protein
LQENGSDPSPDSDSDSSHSSKDSEPCESESSTSDCDEDIDSADVHQEEAIRRSQSRNTGSDSSGDDEVDGELEGRNGTGIVRMQNSEDIATVVDRELISIDSVSIHQNYGRAVTYKGLQEEALHVEQRSTEADSAGPDILVNDTPIPTVTTIESEVTVEAEAGRSKRKRIPRKQVLDTLNGCLCGDVVDPSELPSDTIIKCKEMGCETEWVISISFSIAYNITHPF